MQIIPDSPVPQTVEESSEVMRLQELLLSSVAALSRVQATASSLDQRIIEHERRIQEQSVEDAKVITLWMLQLNRLPARLPKSRKKGRHKKCAVDNVRDGTAGSPGRDTNTGHMKFNGCVSEIRS